MERVLATMSVTLSAVLLASPAAAQRLPQTAQPIHYDITIALDLAAARFSGQERIRVRLTQPASAIVLNAAEIEFHSVTVHAAGGAQKADVTLDEEAEQATVRVPAALPAGEAEIEISYTGILNDDLRGLYLSKANNRRYAVTQLEATDARRMFPSFDEPAFKATFALTAIVDAADRAISNGEIVSDAPGPAGKHTVKFSTTPQMSTYLVALAVGDFECNGDDVNGIPVRICSTPDKKQLTGFALESAKEILRYFNQYYSISYPFQKLDVVAVPDFAAGAMENTGAIFYRETLLLADDSASVSARKQIAAVLAHEIAHQWFGNLVTMRWWDDIWLNEGFATWAQTKPLKTWKPEWQMELTEVLDTERAMALDGLRTTRSLRAKASTPAQINELFDPIAYEKGAAIVRMLESWIGEEPFRKGVNAYLERFKYGNARAEDFWETLAKVTGKPVGTVMATFVDQPGVPLVSVGVECAGTRTGRAMLAQTRYVSDPDAPPSASGPATAAGAAPLWNIPVCLRTPRDAAVCDLLDRRTEEFALGGCAPWVMGNAGARGYYRTAMTPEAIRWIARDVGSLPPAERMALLANQWALVRSGQHDVGATLDLASGFTGERHAAVMSTLVTTLGRIASDLAAPATRGAFERWVASLLAPALADVGWTPAPEEPDDTRALRSLVVGALARTARSPDVLAKAREIVEAELRTPGSVDPTLLDVVVNAASRDGDAALYEQYLTRARSATNPEDRYRFLYGLTSFTDPPLVRRTMELIVSPEVRSQDAKLLIASLLANRDARDLAWDLLRSHWDAIQKKTGEFVGNTVIVGALGSFCDSDRLADVKAFFARHPVPDAERTLRQSLERIGSCATLARAQRPKLAEWLTRHAM
jgi:aminopeptidase N